VLLVAGFVYAKLASCGAVAPASIHEVFQMRRAVTVGNSPFLLVFWGARSDASLDGISKTHGYTELLLPFSITFAHWSQYLSMTAIPLPTSNKASFVAGWPQSRHALGLSETL
jgi:hypothetical protein